LEARKRNSFTSGASTNTFMAEGTIATTSHSPVPKVQAIAARPQKVDIYHKTPHPRRLMSIIRHLIPGPSVSCHRRGEISMYLWVSNPCSLQASKATASSLLTPSFSAEHCLDWVQASDCTLSRECHSKSSSFH